MLFQILKSYCLNIPYKIKCQRNFKNINLSSKHDKVRICWGQNRDFGDSFGRFSQKDPISYHKILMPLWSAFNFHTTLKTILSPTSVTNLSSPTSMKLFAVTHFLALFTIGFQKSNIIAFKDFFNKQAIRIFADVFKIFENFEIFLPSQAIFFNF